MSSVHTESPHDALIKALEHVEDMESVLIIYEGKQGVAAGSFDNDLTVERALWLLEMFKYWLMSSTTSPKD
jgi:hypothetical protein